MCSPVTALSFNAPVLLPSPPDERPELCRGTYEVVATKSYMVRPPMPVIHMFVIDVSHTAMASGATAAVCQCVEQVLESLQGEEATIELRNAQRNTQPVCSWHAILFASFCVGCQQTLPHCTLAEHD